MKTFVFACVAIVALNSILRGIIVTVSTYPRKTEISLFSDICSLVVDMIIGVWGVLLLMGVGE